MHEVRDEAEPTLAQLLAHLSPCDLVLVEGFKAEPVPKLEVYRAEAGKPGLFGERDDIVALASNDAPTTTLPVLPLDQPERIADFILAYLEMSHVEF